jgi:metallophosphoesterase (TIGR03767 family)
MRGEAPARSTIDATIRPGEVLAAGSLSSYRRLEHGPGEPRELRLELAGEAQAGLSPEVRRQRGAESSIFRLAHVTDLQIVDVASPGRFEFFEELRGSPDAGSFVPAQRPQEAMLPHAIDAMVESLNADGGSPDTGASIDVVVSTGDNIDNAQWNELCWYLSLMAGGEVGRRAAGYEGVQSQSWPPGPYWRPDETEGIFQSLYGFPHAPGLLELAAERFVAAGLRLPWVACFGNHDGLVLGESLATADYRQIVVAGRKALALPEGFDPLCNKQRLFDSPELFLAGPGVEVTPDHDRRVIGRREFVAAHLAAGGLPEGHGFKEENLVAGTAYGSYDLSERVRLLLLDTANLDGHHDGSIGVRQMAWLEERLSECHSRHLAPDGGWQRGSGSDRLVVLASHHGMRTLSNTRQSPQYCRFSAASQTLSHG